MAVPVIIGGNGYRWRGRSIRTIQRKNATCVTMPRKDSMVMAKCVVSPGVKYKVVVSAAKGSGNGAILMNFFCGKHYDGTPTAINITSPDMCEYAVIVEAPKFPKSIPIYLRVFRPNNATGNLFIKTIRYEVLANAANIPKIPVAKKIPPERIVGPLDIGQPKGIRKKRRIPSISEQRQRRPVQKRKRHLKENRSMKFKPHKLVRSTDMAKKVFIQSPEDVPMVSIITPTRDGIDLIKDCYNALNKNTCYPNWEWIIGDSYSTDGTAEEIKSWGDPRIKLVERGTTDGSFSSINNELVKFAAGEYLLFLNDDTEPQPFWLYEMVSKIHRHSEIGIVGAKLMYNENKVQHAGIAFIPQGPANIGSTVLKSFPKGFEREDRFYQAVTGACLLMRFSDFKCLGGFDEVYYFCYEDVDLCLKTIHSLKKRVLYAANAVVYHKESVTQDKHRTAGKKQKIGIEIFMNRWMHIVKQDFIAFRGNISNGVRKAQVSFVTCVNNSSQYRTYVVGSLFKNKTNINYEIVPVMNFGNRYSAAEALNVGINRARANVVVLCHQDVLFYEDWINTLFERILEVEKKTKKWGILGTAGITNRDDTIGVVHNMKGKLQWQSSKRAKIFPVQTVDEHCMIIKKNSKLRFDQVTFDGFHFYGPDICLTALNRGFTNFGILCPLVHDSKSSSLISGKKEFMRLLNALSKKWGKVFPFIRTPTSIIRKRSTQTFVKFNNR